jgi:hypothetical protein
MALVHRSLQAIVSRSPKAIAISFGRLIGSLLAITIPVAVSSVSASSQEAATDGHPIAADYLSVTVLLDERGIEKGLTGTHIVQTRMAPRSAPGHLQIAVGCVPCFNVFLSFAIADGRLFAMNWQTEGRLDRYTALVNGKPVPIEPMNRLMGRDWVDAYDGIDQVPGCARYLAQGKDLNAVLKRGMCLWK